MKNVKKILIIQTAFIGDVILTTPLVEALAEDFPDAKIDFLTIPRSKSLLESNPKINNLIIFDKRGQDRGLSGLLRVGNILKNNQYNLCITPHRSLRSAYLSWKTQAEIRIGFDRTAWKSAFTHIVKYESGFHEIERNLSLLSAIGISKNMNFPVLYSTAQDKDKVDAFLYKTNLDEKKKLFAVAPGSVWATKRWLEDYYKKFCHLMEDQGLKIVLVGGQEDQDLCERIAGYCHHVLTAAGNFNLRETYYLLTKCSGILSNDSAPLHLGMAAGITVFAIFGPTVPEFGFAPFGPHSKTFENRELACRPCAIHGSNKCPIKTFECMESLAPEDITKQVLDKLQI